VKTSPRRWIRNGFIGFSKRIRATERNSMDLIVDSRTLKTVPDENEGVRLVIPEDIKLIEEIKRVTHR